MTGLDEAGDAAATPCGRRRLAVQLGGAGGHARVARRRGPGRARRLRRGARLGRAGRCRGTPSARASRSSPARSGRRPARSASPRRTSCCSRRPRSARCARARRGAAAPRRCRTSGTRSRRCRPARAPSGLRGSSRRCSPPACRSTSGPAGAWHAEWRPLSDLLVRSAPPRPGSATASSISRSTSTAMRANLDRTGGLLLAERVATALDAGARQARGQRPRRASGGRPTTGRSRSPRRSPPPPEIREHLSPERIAELLEPAGCRRERPDLFVDRALAAHRAHGDADARERRGPPRRRGSGGRAGPRVLSNSLGSTLDDVGSAGAEAVGALPGGALRPPGPRALSGPAGPVRRRGRSAAISSRCSTGSASSARTCAALSIGGLVSMWVASARARAGRPSGAVLHDARPFAPAGAVDRARGARPRAGAWPRSPTSWSVGGSRPASPPRTRTS